MKVAVACTELPLTVLIICHACVMGSEGLRLRSEIQSYEDEQTATNEINEKVRYSIRIVYTMRETENTIHLMVDICWDW